MKNQTLIRTGSPSPFLKPFLLWSCLTLGSTLAATSQLTVNSAFPANTTICTFSNATFTAVATGSGTLSYQWQESIDGGITWNPLVENTSNAANPATGIYTGTMTAVLTISNLPSGMNGNKYQAVISNGTNTATTVAATLNVGPDVTSVNVTSTNCPGTNATLSTANVSGVSYQWQVSSNGGTGWSNITNGADATGVTYAGGATGTLTISGLTTNINNYLYRYSANDGAGCAVTSATTTQNVPTPASFTLPAAGSITANVGQSLSIPATITGGTSPFTYQWQVAVGAGSFTNISTTNATYTGATSATLTIASMTTALYSDRYRVIVRNNPGNCVSSNAAFVQIGNPAVLAIQLESFTAQNPGNSSVKLFWTVAAGDGASEYIVQKSTDGNTFTNIGQVTAQSGETTYNFTDANAAYGRFEYRLEMTQQDGSEGYSQILTMTNDKISTRVEMRPSVVAGGTANLYTVMPQNEIVMLTVIDVAGRQLWSQFMSLGKGEYYTPMSVSRLSKGMYYMKVTSNDGISTVLSFIKN